MIPLSYDLTPKTLSLVIKENYNSSGTAAKEAIQVLKGELKLDDTAGYSTIIAEYSYVTESGQRETRYIDFTDWQNPQISQQQVAQMMYQLGTQLESAEGIPCAETYISIYYDYNAPINGTWETGRNLVYFPLPRQFETEQLAAIAYAYGS